MEALDGGFKVVDAVVEANVGLVWRIPLATPFPPHAVIVGGSGLHLKPIIVLRHGHPKIRSDMGTHCIGRVR